MMPQASKIKPTVSKEMLIKQYRIFEKVYFETGRFDKAIKPLVKYLEKKGIEVTK